MMYFDRSDETDEEPDSIKELSRQTGIKQGIQQGRKEGVQQGREEERKKIMASLLVSTSLNDEEIHEIFPEYSVEQISQLRCKLKKK